MHNVWGSHRVGYNPLAMDSPNSGDVDGCPEHPDGNTNAVGAERVFCPELSGNC